MSKPVDKFFIKPTNIDWDDDASISAGAKQIFQLILAKRNQTGEQLTEQKKRKVIDEAPCGVNE